MKTPIRIHEGVHSTGELAGVEQSLLVETDKGLVIIVGCSHPGVRTVLDVASRCGPPRALVGGLHGFREFELIDQLELVCPTHCTQRTTQIADRFPDKTVAGGAGRVIQI